MFLCILRESDINFSWNQDDFEGFLPPKVCGYVKENATDEGEDLEESYHKATKELELLSSDGNSSSDAARQKRQAPEFLTILRQTRCPLLLVADYR